MPMFLMVLFGSLLERREVSEVSSKESAEFRVSPNPFQLLFADPNQHPPTAHAHGTTSRTILAPSLPTEASPPI